LRDVDELVAAHGAVTGGGPGRPAKRQGAAITRAGVVLLAAAMEAFVEDLFEEAGEIVFSALRSAERTELYRATSRRMNNADVHKTNLLFFNLGAPWILRRVRWQKCSNAQFQTRLNRLVEVRGQIAHGRQPGVRLQELRGWKRMVEKYAEVLEIKVAEHIQTTTGRKVGW
jgi:hypothetical protein